ncbi:ligase-associated DNA damage response DEXH box helicase [Lichenicoccus roseus]|uniref:Ligase-associated DNA damage response DEXH box helicase n=1 Tax=Lichenicoccus roseus TaxID=2683649 RepID=A0A5R9J4Y5_9PROT|nr:ligase-associated DNA damage response DEXH box helicase [Lichenicoccus roseus]TLU72039.1 ligase-associated DNA damage response DEXH box helicase [Lichenicoccus roseus]
MNASLPAPFVAWFARRGWMPRAHQIAVLDAASRNQDVLLIAPTGGGKTLAGFLPSLVELGRQPADGLHTLYVSPLKALATDIARNLTAPVEEMGLAIAIETRTGDTPADRRARQRERPPQILLTTPESLALLLSRRDAGSFFAGLRRIVIDEAHALAGTKRGDQLALCLARLSQLAPAARRIGLSATVADPDLLRRYVGLDTPARLIEAEPGAAPRIGLMLPQERVPWSGRMGLAGASAILDRIGQAGMTIVFVNTRAQAELLFQAIWRINEATLPIALHHGSLDINQRRRVEAAMARGGGTKDGLRAVIATSSLDLGIDWGGIDQVIQVGAPKGVSRLLQRVGRANHRMDESSAALLVPANRFEVLECEAAIQGVAAGELDGDPPVPGGLDVLAQHLLLMAASGPFGVEAMYDEVRLAQPYAELSRRDYDDVLGFVEDGGYALAAYDRYRKLFRDAEGLVHIRGERVARQARMNAGTIVEAPVLKVRLGGPRGLVLGEIEESFANHLREGDAFMFAGRKLRFLRLREVNVEVSDGASGDPLVPTWAGSKNPLTSGLAARVRRMLHDPEARLLYPEPVQEWLRLQLEHSVLPGPDDLLVEIFPRHGRMFLIAYCFEGRLAHQTLGMLLTRRLARAGAQPLGFVASDYAIAIWCAEAPPADIGGLFAQEMLGDDLEAWMAESSMLRRTFRNVAVVAGLIERQHPGANASRRQVTVNTDLVYDVLRRHQPDHVLLRATRQEAAGGLTDIGRLGDLLARIVGRVRVMRLDRVSPLAVPVMLDIGREHVRDEDAEDSLLAETEALIAEATGAAEPSTEEMRIAPGHAQELRRLTRQPGVRQGGRRPRPYRGEGGGRSPAGSAARAPGRPGDRP